MSSSTDGSRVIPTNQAVLNLSHYILKALIINIRGFYFMNRKYTVGIFVLSLLALFAASFHKAQATIYSAGSLYGTVTAVNPSNNTLTVLENNVSFVVAVDPTKAVLEINKVGAPGALLSDFVTGATASIKAVVNTGNNTAQALTATSSITELVSGFSDSGTIVSVSSNSFTFTDNATPAQTFTVLPSSYTQVRINNVITANGINQVEVGENVDVLGYYKDATHIMSGDIFVTPGTITLPPSGGMVHTGGTTAIAPVISSISPASGPAGSTFIITGSGFVGLNSVTWTGPGADFSLTPTSISPTSITFTVPSNSVAGSYNVSVLEKYGTSDTPSISSNV